MKPNVKNLAALAIQNGIDELEHLSNEEAEELEGGGLNGGCSTNTGCGPNTSCGGPKTPEILE